MLGKLNANPLTKRGAPSGTGAFRPAPALPGCAHQGTPAVPKMRSWREGLLVHVAWSTEGSAPLRFLHEGQQVCSTSSSSAVFVVYTQKSRWPQMKGGTPATLPASLLGQKYQSVRLSSASGRFTSGSLWGLLTASVQLSQNWDLSVKQLF